MVSNYRLFTLLVCHPSTCGLEPKALVSPAIPSRVERGSGELPIVELFCTAPKTGWSRNVIMRCGFHNNVVLRNTHGSRGIAARAAQLGIRYLLRPHCYENHTSLSHSLTTLFWVLYRTTLLWAVHQTLFPCVRVWLARLLRPLPTHASQRPEHSQNMHSKS